MSHPKRATDQPLNVSVDNAAKRPGHQLSVITVTDPNLETRNGKMDTDLS